MLYDIEVRYPAQQSFWIKHESKLDVNGMLALVFNWFNVGSGQEHEMFLKTTMRSLSIHDFVCLNGQWFQCRTDGWATVTMQEIRALETKMEQHHLFHRSPWFALQDILWKEKQTVG